MSDKQAVVLLSGGLDSSTLFYDLLSQGYTVAGIGIDYGQRHGKELSAAMQIAQMAAARFGARTNFTTQSFPSLRHVLSGSSQTDSLVPVPHGHYADASMKATVVPNRNMILLAIATGYAVSLNYPTVAYAAHAGDHPIYPDCRPEFADAMARAMRLASYEPISLYRPYIDISKTDIASRAYELDVPIEQTWSCYEGLDVHCGKCGTCVERIEAIRDAGIEDPTQYAS